MGNKWGKSRAGFTLIELLVVVVVMMVLQGFLMGKVKKARFLDEDANPNNKSTKATKLEFTSTFNCPNPEQFEIVPNSNELGEVIGTDGEKFPILKASEIEYLEINDPIVFQITPATPQIEFGPNQINITTSFELPAEALTSKCQATFVALVDRSKIFDQAGENYWTAKPETEANIHFIMGAVNVSVLDFLPQAIRDQILAFQQAGVAGVQSQLPPFGATVLASFEGVTVGNGGDQNATSVTEPNESPEYGFAAACGLMANAPKPSLTTFGIIAAALGACLLVTRRRLARQNSKS